MYLSLGDRPDLLRQSPTLLAKRASHFPLRLLVLCLDETSDCPSFRRCLHITDALPSENFDPDCEDERTCFRKLSEILSAGAVDPFVVKIAELSFRMRSLQHLCSYLTLLGVLN